MTDYGFLLAISLIANALLFVGFLWLKNTLSNCWSVIEGLTNRLNPKSK